VLTGEVGVEDLVFSEWEERAVVEREPVVELFVHDLGLQGHDQLLLLLLLLVEVQLLALALLDQLVHGVVLAAARDGHPLRVSQLGVVLD